MTELSEKESKELGGVLLEIRKTIKRCRVKCSEKWQNDFLDEVERIVNQG